MRKKEYREEIEQLNAIINVYRDHVSTESIEKCKMKSKMENEFNSIIIAKELVNNDLRKRNNKLKQQIVQLQESIADEKLNGKRLYSALSKEEEESTELKEEIDRSISTKELIEILPEEIIDKFRKALNEKNNSNNSFGCPF